jgi:hypothetical protein
MRSNVEDTVDDITRREDGLVFVPNALAAVSADLLSACEAALHELREYCPNVSGEAITACEAAVKKARTK